MAVSLNTQMHIENEKNSLLPNSNKLKLYVFPYEDILITKPFSGLRAKENNFDGD